jgi:hypothetical protein
VGPYDAPAPGATECANAGGNDSGRADPAELAVAVAAPRTRYPGGFPAAPNPGRDVEWLIRLDCTCCDGGDGLCDAFVLLERPALPAPLLLLLLIGNHALLEAYEEYAASVAAMVPVAPAALDIGIPICCCCATSVSATDGPAMYAGNT